MRSDGGAIGVVAMAGRPAIAVLVARSDRRTHPLPTALGCGARGRQEQEHALTAQCTGDRAGYRRNDGPAGTQLPEPLVSGQVGSGISRRELAGVSCIAAC
eukprot:scaffold7215_cov366-Prasinococcus_capsulatus_cf.AAC.11